MLLSFTVWLSGVLFIWGLIMWLLSDSAEAGVN